MNPSLCNPLPRSNRNKPVPHNMRHDPCGMTSSWSGVVNHPRTNHNHMRHGKPCGTTEAAGAEWKPPSHQPRPRHAGQRSARLARMQLPTEGGESTPPTEWRNRQQPEELNPGCCCVLVVLSAWAKHTKGHSYPSPPPGRKSLTLPASA